jgi:hypothetical protein
MQKLCGITQRARTAHSLLDIKRRETVHCHSPPLRVAVGAQRSNRLAARSNARRRPHRIKPIRPAAAGSNGNIG